MKVNWFHLMPYRWLPDDFRERYHGVWVDLPDGPSRAAWGALSGSPGELATALRRFADAGFSQVQVWLNVPTVAGIDDGRRTLRFRRGKTNVQVEIEIVGELETALSAFFAKSDATSHVRSARGWQALHRRWHRSDVSAVLRQGQRVRLRIA